jgi:hypothetical protein
VAVWVKNPGPTADVAIKKAAPKIADFCTVVIDGRWVVDSLSDGVLMFILKKLGKEFSFLL